MRMCETFLVKKTMCIDQFTWNNEYVIIPIIPKHNTAMRINTHVIWRNIQPFSGSTRRHRETLRCTNTKLCLPRVWINDNTLVFVPDDINSI